MIDIHIIVEPIGLGIFILAMTIIVYVCEILSSNLKKG